MNTDNDNPCIVQLGGTRRKICTETHKNTYAKIFGRISRKCENFSKCLKICCIFCANPSIGLADKFLFENESCILKIKFFFNEFSQLFRSNFAFVLSFF